MLCLLLLVVVLCCGCQPQVSNTELTENTEETQSTEIELKYDITKESFLKMRDCLDNIPRVPIIGVKNGSYYELSNKGDYFVMQGGCTDGKYAYFILEGQDLMMDGVLQDAVHKIYKVDMSTWELVDESEPLLLGHGNSITYNSKRNQLVVVHYVTNDVSFVNPDNLEIEEQITLDFKIANIAYNESRDQYVAGYNAREFSILDANFEELAFCRGHNIDLGTQDVDCDDNYIYVGNSGVVSHPGVEVVKVYNWDCEYVGIFRADTVSEQEAIFNYDGKYYMSFYTGNGGRVYEIQYDFELLAE